MRKAKIRRIERIEHYLVRIIQQPGADQGHPWAIRTLLKLRHSPPLSAGVPGD